MPEEKEEKKAKAENPAVEQNGPKKEDADASEVEATAKVEKAVALSGFYGVKAGMTRIFDSEGRHVPVTVIKLIPNFITQVKTLEKDGHRAYQIAYGEKREKLLNRPVKGLLAKAKVKKNLAHFAEVKAGDVDSAHLGREVSLENFSASTLVDVTGMSKGKGFQGVVKRWNFSQGPLSHGSKFHRTGGAIGNRATPGRVWKNKKMPGHMGMVKKTVLNLQVVEVNQKGGYLLVKGAVPGAQNSFIHIKKAVKVEGKAK